MSIGRFTTRDSYTGRSSDLLSLNLYTYCANNPVLYIDPSGHSFLEVAKGAVIVGAGIAIGGAIGAGVTSVALGGLNASTTSTTTKPPSVTTQPATTSPPEKIPTTSGIRQKQLNFNPKLSDEKKDFASGVFNSALLLESKIGVPAEIVTAQACLESGWGESVPVDRNTGKYSYNIFGIKGTGTAGSVNCRTREVINGESIYINDDFAAYNNFEECLAGYDDFLTNRSLYSYDDLFGNMNVDDWAYGLQSHHYATDPDYPDLLLNIINDWLGVQ